MTLGPGCRVLGSPSVRIDGEARVVLGAGAVLNSVPDGYHAAMSIPVTLLADRAGARIQIGDGSRLHGCFVHAWSGVSLGRECLVAAGAQLIDAHGHATEMRFARVRTRLRDEPEPIAIGDHCWIGLGALVFKGARLGEGCVVAAYSVVGAGDYPAFSVIAGAPARVVSTADPTEVLPEDHPLTQLGVDHRIYRY